VPLLVHDRSLDPKLPVVLIRHTVRPGPPSPEPRNIPPSTPYLIFPLGSTPLARFTLELFQGEMIRNVTVRLLSSGAFSWEVKWVGLCPKVTDAGIDPAYDSISHLFPRGHL
jgi:hypothetical protein